MLCISSPLIVEQYDHINDDRRFQMFRVARGGRVEEMAEFIAAGFDVDVQDEV